jgi:membrane protein required for colicin V production
MGPVDRVLGLGFGMVKGLVIMIVAFSLVVLGYDMVWSERGRPDWITQAQTYTLLDAGSRSLVEMIAQVRERLSSDAG